MVKTILIYRRASSGIGEEARLLAAEHTVYAWSPALDRTDSLERIP